MRLRFIKPDPEQRAALRDRFASLQDPAAVKAWWHLLFPPPSAPVELSCTPQSFSPDRFIIRLEMATADGRNQAFALKCYVDNRGEAIMALYKALAARWTGEPGPPPVWLPLTYVPEQHLLISPWVEGPLLPTCLEQDRADLLAQAATILANLHSCAVVPEAPTTAQAIVDDTLDRCERLRQRWPGVGDLVQPLATTLCEVLPFLDAARPVPVHGDPSLRNFVWMGMRLVLLDLDMFGYTDPAYDAGHFLAQLQRWCLADSARRERAPQWLATFRDAYMTAMPAVASRNISFYHGLTLIRKMYTVCRKQEEGWPDLLPQLAAAVRRALQQVTSPEKRA